MNPKTETRRMKTEGHNSRREDRRRTLDRRAERDAKRRVRSAS